MENKIQKVEYNNYEIGDSAYFSKTITEADIILFAGISGDFNPLHIDNEFSKTTRFGKRIIHGIFSSALISACLGTKLFGPGILYISQTTTFKKPTFVGDTLTAIAIVTEKFLAKNGEKKFIRCATNVYNQNNVLVTEGTALLLFI